MNRKPPRVRSLLAVLGLGALAACAASRPPLPPPPPPKGAIELSTWASPPPLAPEPEVALPMSIERVTLPNGLGVTIVTRPETKITAIELWMPSAGDPSQGPVATMGDALRAGTRMKDGSLLVNPKLASEPIAVRTAAAGTSFSWVALPRASEQALRLLASFVFRPAFDPEETESRLRELFTSVLTAADGWGHVERIARRALPGLVIPTPEQDVRGLFKLKPEGLRHIHRCTITPHGAELAIVSPLPANDVAAWARAAFGDIAPPPPESGCEALAVPALDAEAAKLSRLELGIIYGGRFDPMLQLVLPGPGLASDEYLPFALLAEVLQVRDEGPAQALRHAGVTYGIHASLDSSLSGLTLLEFSGQVEPQNAQNALRNLVEDMHALAETLTDAQIDEVKRRWRNAYIVGLSSNAAVAGAAIWHTRRGRHPGALMDWPNEVMQVSLQRCRDVSRRWLSDAQPSVVVTGLPVRLARGLGLGARIHEMYWTDKPQEHRKRF